jgi:uncharacterized protein
MLEFEWNEEKRKQNLAKHGVDFAEACFVFNDHFRIELLDDRFHYEEVREIAIGMVKNQLLTVIYVNRDDKFRLISARPASRNETDVYFANEPDT